jgi:hypothetical protein
MAVEPTGIQYQVYAAGTDSGATATEAATTSTGGVHHVTCISGFSDADCKITVEDGSTVLLEIDLDVSLQGKSFHLSGLNLQGTSNTAMNGKISASTADCAITIMGYTAGA